MMGVALRLDEVDQELSQLGVVPDAVAQRAHAALGELDLAAIDRTLDDLANGVVVASVVAPRVVAGVAAVAKAAPAAVAAPVVIAAPLAFEAVAAEARARVEAEPVVSVEPAAVVTAVDEAAPGALSAEEEALNELDAALGASPSHAPAAATSPSESMAPLESLAPTLSVESLAPTLSVESLAPSAVSDAPFVPTLPSQPPPAFDDAPVSRSSRPPLSMSEPPLSEPPPLRAAPPADVDPFEGKPAPMPVPQRAPSVWPMAPAPKRQPAKTIRTSVAPPPLPASSMRPRPAHPLDAPVRRPSDTPDPFAPLNRASSRPPVSPLDNDQLFGGISNAPPSGSAPVKLSAPPAPKVPSRMPQPPMSAAPKATAGDEIEMLVDDEEMIEIDVDEME